MSCELCPLEGLQESDHSENTKSARLQEEPVLMNLGFCCSEIITDFWSDGRCNAALEEPEIKIRFFGGKKAGNKYVSDILHDVYHLQHPTTKW